MSGKPAYAISTAAAMLAVHPRTLRNYEKAGLVKPARRGKWRYYSDNDIFWLRCLFGMVHEHGINIESVGKLLRIAPCWEIADCPKTKRANCLNCQLAP